MEGKSLPSEIKTPYPVIGLVTQEVNYTKSLFQNFLKESEESMDQEYTCSSYVKFLEQAGARVVPIFVHRDKEYYQNMFNMTNGLLIPGGSAGLETTGEI